MDALREMYLKFEELESIADYVDSAQRTAERDKILATEEFLAARNEQIGHHVRKKSEAVKRSEDNAAGLQSALERLLQSAESKGCIPGDVTLPAPQLADYATAYRSAREADEELGRVRDELRNLQSEQDLMEKELARLQAFDLRSRRAFRGDVVNSSIALVGLLLAIPIHDDFYHCLIVTSVSVILWLRLTRSSSRLMRLVTHGNRVQITDNRFRARKARVIVGIYMLFALLFILLVIPLTGGIGSSFGPFYWLTGAAALTLILANRDKPAALDGAHE
jgi:hypothetical protein